MALFRRNVVGSDILSLWNHIAHHGPIERTVLVDRFYPGNAEDADESDQRKTLNDGIDFLVEVDQITETDDGFVLTDVAEREQSPRTALLWGIRSREGENAAYNDVLDVLTEDDRVYFDRGDPLEDLLSGRRTDVTWNSTRLNYWRRVMEMLGVVRDLDTDTDEEYTSMLTLQQSVLAGLLGGIIDPNEPARLDQVLSELDDRYLPVYSGSTRNAVATYLQRALLRAKRNNLVQLQQDSDFGPTVELDGSGYNAITLRTQGHS